MDLLQEAATLAEQGEHERAFEIWEKLDLTCDSWSSLMFPRMVERRVRNHAETTVYDGRDYSQAA